MQPAQKIRVDFHSCCGNTKSLLFVSNRELTNPPMRPPQNPSEDFWTGVGIVIVCGMLWILVFFFFVVCPFLPPCGITAVDAVIQDPYYRLAIPMFPAVSVLFLIFNWFYLKRFKHN
jgi:hypothetical protein